MFDSCCDCETSNKFLVYRYLCFYIGLVIYCFYMTTNIYTERVAVYNGIFCVVCGGIFCAVYGGILYVVGDGYVF